MIEQLVLPAQLGPADSGIVIRRATHGDLESLLRLIYEDPVTAGRGDT